MSREGRVRVVNPRWRWPAGPKETGMLASVLIFIEVLCCLIIKRGYGKRRKDSPSLISLYEGRGPFTLCELTVKAQGEVFTPPSLVSSSKNHHLWVWCAWQRHKPRYTLISFKPHNHLISRKPCPHFRNEEMKLTDANEVHIGPLWAGPELNLGHSNVKLLSWNLRLLRGLTDFFHYSVPKNQTFCPQKCQCSCSVEIIL